MERDIIIIDEDQCIGCGQCVGGCHEGALQMIEGKARLIGDLLCDGLGACIGHCPTGALTIVRREAEPYDEIKVMDGLRTKGSATIKAHLEHLRDHKQVKFFNIGLQYLVDHHLSIPEDLTFIEEQKSEDNRVPADSVMDTGTSLGMSALDHWPIQLHLVMPQSVHFKGADLLLAADCSAFALGSFHSRLLAGKKLAIACPKLDSSQGYLEKLIAFIDEAEIKSLTVVTMQVPCCGGLWALAQKAVAKAIRSVDLKREIVNIDGSLR